MAKAKKPAGDVKKPEAAKTSEAAKKPAASAAAGGDQKSAKGKAPASKAGATKAKAARGSGAGGGGAPTTPMIDTNLAAQAAAKMLAAGLQPKNPAAGTGAAASGAVSSAGKPQSALFRQLKDGLSKPHLSGMDSVLDKGAAPGSKRPNLPTGNERTAHNQTFGADVNRAGVPRRTPG